MDCDGYSVADGDCDDPSALVSRVASETPYDNRDNDCAGDGDTNDIDYDGYVGVKAEREDDFAHFNPVIYLGILEDRYDDIEQNCVGYDGLGSKCDGGDDFDQEWVEI